LENVSALNQSGYLTIPSFKAIESINTIGPTVFGGLFFTLSTGALLTMATVVALWIWNNLSRRSRTVLILLLIIWTASLVKVNANGLSLFGSLYFFLIPAAISLVYHVCRPKTSDFRKSYTRLLPLYPLVLLALIWGIQADRQLFINIRDFLLLSNPVGKSVNDYYYRYTLYPAEAFKSQEQKLQRPIKLIDIEPVALKRKLEAQMRYRDYLAVGTDETADIQITHKENRLQWLYNGQPILSVSPESFFTNPVDVFKQYSRKTDRSAFLRTVTFFGILLAFPILLYCCVYGTLRLLAGLFLQPLGATLLASILCFGIGIILLIPVYQGSQRPVAKENLAEALNAEDWRDRVAGLKLVEQLKLEITAYSTYEKSMTSRHLPERYWLSHALGLSHEDHTIDDLIKLLNDPQNNVVCQALYALGQRGKSRKPEIIDTILLKIRTTNDWYVQRYAYLALRSLGWWQPASN
jgi:hypothetical protein